MESLEGIYNEETQSNTSQAEDSGVIVFKTPIPTGDMPNRIVSTLEKEDDRNANEITFGQDQELSAIGLVAELGSGSEGNQLSEVEQLMKFIATMNKQTTDSINKNTENINKRIDENALSIKTDNIIQIEKLKESMELKMNTFISKQETEAKIFRTSVIKDVEDKNEQVKSEIKILISEEVENRELQEDLIKGTIMHNREEILERLEEHKSELNVWELEVEKINRERGALLDDKIIRNSRAISLINREVEDMGKRQNQVREEVIMIRDKIESNTGVTPVTTSHLPNVRVNIPTFSGNNNTTMPPHFITLIEEYFAITKVKQTEWLIYLGQAFQGSAIAWYRQIKPMCTSWDVFKQKFLENYHGPVQRMKYATQVEESRHMANEKAETFIWRINDVIKLAYPYLREEEIVMCILRKMKSGFGTLLRDNIKTVLDLVQKAIEMEEVIRLDGRNSSNTQSEGQSDYNKSRSNYNRQNGQYDQANYSRQGNDRGWQGNNFRSDRGSGNHDRTPRDNNQGYSQNRPNHSDSSQSNYHNQGQTDGKGHQQQIATVSKGKGVGKKSVPQDTNIARSKTDGDLNGAGRVTAGLLTAPSTST